MGPSATAECAERGRGVVPVHLGRDQASVSEICVRMAACHLKANTWKIEGTGIEEEDFVVVVSLILTTEDEEVVLVVVLDNGRAVVLAFSRTLTSRSTLRPRLQATCDVQVQMSSESKHFSAMGKKRLR